MQRGFHQRCGSGAVRLVCEHESEHALQSAAIPSAAQKVGCPAEMLGCVRQAERNNDAGRG